MLLVGVSGGVGDHLTCLEGRSVGGIGHGSDGDSVARVAHIGIEGHHQAAERIGVGIQYFGQNEILFSPRIVRIEVDGFAAAVRIVRIIVSVRIRIGRDSFVAFRNTVVGSTLEIITEREGCNAATVGIGGLDGMVHVDVIEVVIAV